MLAGVMIIWLMSSERPPSSGADQTVGESAYRRLRQDILFGRLAPGARLRLDALRFLGRLYWFTVEFGLIRTAAGLRIYGSGILSSKGESIYCLDSPGPNRVGFDLLRIMRTQYRIDSFQKTYFVIDSFAELFEATQPDFTPYYEVLRELPEIPAGDVVATDRVLQRGNREGWADTPDMA